jgi:diaminopimelate epimerase
VSYPFRKGHGTENDFVLLPDPDGSVHGDLSAERVRALCDRRAGIGADGVLRVIRAAVVEERSPVVEERSPVVEERALRASRNHPEDDARPEWFMDYRNADGSVAEICGNGIRVFAKHLYDEGLVAGDRPVPIATRAGVMTVTRNGEAYTADLGVATIVGETKVSVGDRSWAAQHVEVGNPHAVVVVDDLAEAGALSHAPAYDEELFPQGVNVEFVVRRGREHIALRVHERGVGETRSCGTGSCAAAVVALRGVPGRMRVDVPGGTVGVTFGPDGRVFLSGPAVIVARGETDL